VTARGVDTNAAMVAVAREQGLDVTRNDALGYVASLPDESIGGVIATQVVEHLEPSYLFKLLDALSRTLRRGAPIVLETINPACWYAFFSSYIRDITHVRPLHPDTLKYLVGASGFQKVAVRFSAPYPDEDKLQPLPPKSETGKDVEAFNENVRKLNALLFTYLDYAAIGERL